MWGPRVPPSPTRGSLERSVGWHEIGRTGSIGVVLAVKAVYIVDGMEKEDVRMYAWRCSASMQHLLRRYAWSFLIRKESVVGRNECQKYSSNSIITAIIAVVAALLLALCCSGSSSSSRRGLLLVDQKRHYF